MKNPLKFIKTVKWPKFWGLTPERLGGRKLRIARLFWVAGLVISIVGPFIMFGKNYSLVHAILSLAAITLYMPFTIMVVKMGRQIKAELFELRMKQIAIETFMQFTDPEGYKRMMDERAVSAIFNGGKKVK